MMILLMAGVGALCSPGRAVQYEPPINIAFIIHVEPVTPDSTGYAARIAFLQWLRQEAASRPFPFKMTILMNGSFAEWVLHYGDQQLFRDLEADGHELGTHAHSVVYQGPFNWLDVTDSTGRYGIPNYDPLWTQQIWNDATYWVDQLTDSNLTMCAFPFLCSDEGQFMNQFGFLSGPGNRSEKGLDYLGRLIRHPFRPGSDNRLGHELEENLSSPFIYIDHYAQIGNPEAHGYNCTEPAMEAALNQCYQEWLVQEMMQGDSLNYKVWTFGFLTHLWLFSPYYQQQISTFMDFIEANFVGHYTPRNNLIARYSTCREVVSEYLDWEASHPGQSSFSYIHPYPQVPLINEAMIIPQDLTQGSEWVEVYNPTAQWLNLGGYKFTNGLLGAPEHWQFPPSSWLGPFEHLVAAHNGSLFRNRYGLRPDFEVTGGTGARVLTGAGFFTLHDDVDGCALINTAAPAPMTNTSITDALSWGGNHVAGFTLPEPGVGQTYGRNAQSLDTGYGSDWHLNGAAGAPTPGGANSAGYFQPQVFVRIDPAAVPLQVPSSGGELPMYVTLGNELASAAVVDAWTSVVMPSGAVVGPLLLRQNRTLSPQDSFLVTLTQMVPGGAPPGFYRFDVRLGDYPNVVTDLAYLYFQKTGPGHSDDIWPETNTDLPLGLEAGDDRLPVPGEGGVRVSPNPFNAEARLDITLPPGGEAQLEIYDLAGRRISVASLPAQAGIISVTFDGRSLSSGLYLAVLTTPLGRVSAKMLLLK